MLVCARPPCGKSPIEDKSLQTIVVCLSYFNVEIYVRMIIVVSVELCIRVSVAASLRAMPRHPVAASQRATLIYVSCLRFPWGDFLFK